MIEEFKFSTTFWAQIARKFGTLVHSRIIAIQVKADMIYIMIPQSFSSIDHVWTHQTEQSFDRTLRSLAA